MEGEGRGRGKGTGGGGGGVVVVGVCVCKDRGWVWGLRKGESWSAKKLSLSLCGHLCWNILMLLLFMHIIYKMPPPPHLPV